MPQTASDPLVARFLRTRHGWSDHHRENAVGCLNRWSRWLAEPHDDLPALTSVVDATPDHCNVYLTARLGVVGQSTARKDYQFLGWLYQWLVEQEELPDVTKAGRQVAQRGAGPMNGAQKVSDGEIDPARLKRIDDAHYRKLLAHFPKRSLLGRRNRAMVSLMYRSGLRRSEVAKAELGRCDLDARVLEVHRKGRNGGKWGKVYLSDETVDLLDAYLTLRGHDASPALFASSFGGADGALGTGHLSPDSISSIIDRANDELGLDVSCHQLRRAWARQARRRELSDDVIMNQGGWSGKHGATMLDRYAGRDDERALAAFAAADDTAPRRRARRLKVVGGG